MSNLNISIQALCYLEHSEIRTHLPVYPTASSDQKSQVQLLRNTTH